MADVLAPTACRDVMVNWWKEVHLPASYCLIDFIFWLKLGKTPGLLAPVSQLPQNRTSTEGRQILGTCSTDLVGVSELMQEVSIRIPAISTFIMFWRRRATCHYERLDINTLVVTILRFLSSIFSFHKKWWLPDTGLWVGVWADHPSHANRRAAL